MIYPMHYIRNWGSFTSNDVWKLQEISNKKFDLVQRILLIDLGNTQQLLEAIYNTETKIRVIAQIEGKNIINRRTCIVSLSNNILAYANSKIYWRKIPHSVLDEIRQRKVGIGKIFLYHGLEIFKKITEIGYVPDRHIFKNYSLYHKDNLICKINEMFPLLRNKLDPTNCDDH